MNINKKRKDFFQWSRHTPDSFLFIVLIYILQIILHLFYFFYEFFFFIQQHLFLSSEQRLNFFIPVLDYITENRNIYQILVNNRNNVMMSNKTIKKKERSSGYTTRESHLHRLGLNEDAAWQEFYKKYRAMIFGIGAARHLSDQECEDLMQEVALICCSKLQNFVYDPSKCRFRTFLYRITENVAFNLFRKKNAEAFESLKNDYSGIPELDIKFMQEYEDFLLERSLQILKNSISSESYLAFDMLFNRNLPVKEVVARTGMSASALYTNKHRCLKKLREIIFSLSQALETPPGTVPEAE